MLVGQADELALAQVKEAKVRLGAAYIARQNHRFLSAPDGADFARGCRPQLYTGLQCRWSTFIRSLAASGPSLPPGQLGKGGGGSGCEASRILPTTCRA